MSRKLRFVLAGAGLVVIIVLAWVFLLNPLRGDIAAVSESIATEKVQLATAQAKLAQAEVTREEGKKNQARLLELAKMVPSSDEIPSLLVQIQDLADQSGVDFTAITPGSVIQFQGFYILPLSVQFTGTFFDLSDFVYRAEHLVAGPGRLLAVKELSLEAGGDIQGSGGGGGGAASPRLDVSMTLYAFETGETKGATAAALPGEEGATTSTTEASGS